MKCLFFGILHHLERFHVNIVHQYLIPAGAVIIRTTSSKALATNAMLIWQATCPARMMPSPFSVLVLITPMLPSSPYTCRSHARYKGYRHGGIQRGIANLGKTVKTSQKRKGDVFWHMEHRDVRSSKLVCSQALTTPKVTWRDQTVSPKADGDG